MKLSLELQQRLEQRMELRQQLKMQLSQEMWLLMLQTLEEEFLVEIETDSDGDLDLFERSALFIFLHEYGHPILDAYNSFFSYSCFQDVPGSEIQGKEVYVDSIAIASGKNVTDFPMERLMDSHYAVAERVFRDSASGKIEQNVYFLARLGAELEVNLEFVRSPEISDLAKQYNETWERVFGDSYKQAKDLYKSAYSDGLRSAESIFDQRREATRQLL